MIMLFKQCDTIFWTEKIPQHTFLITALKPLTEVLAIVFFSRNYFSLLEGVNCVTRGQWNWGLCGEKDLICITHHPDTSHRCQSSPVALCWHCSAACEGAWPVFPYHRLPCMFHVLWSHWAGLQDKIAM